MEYLWLAPKGSWGDVCNCNSSSMWIPKAVLEMRGCSKGTVLSLLMGILSISLATDLSEELATVNLSRKQSSPLALAPWNYMDSKDWSEVWRSEPLGFWNKTGPTVLGTALSQPSSCFVVILLVWSWMWLSLEPKWLPFCHVTFLSFSWAFHTPNPSVWPYRDSKLVMRSKRPLGNSWMLSFYPMRNDERDISHIFHRSCFKD